MQSDEIIIDLADLFKIFSDSTRLKILIALTEGEKCVTDIGEELEMSATAISHQLRILKQSHLVKYRRDGKQIYYSLADDHVEKIIDCGIDHIEE